MDNIISEQLFRQYEMMVEWVNGNLNLLSDEEFKIELAPGKNHGVWILGHLVVCDDDLSEFLGKGDLLFSEYVKMFGQGSKLMPVDKYPDVSKLKDCWEQVCNKNRKIYSGLADKELSERHVKITNYETDYFKTKERVIMAWQFHQMFHAGQLSVIVSKAGKSQY